MIVGLKDATRQIIISIMAAAAVFISTLFLNYNLDIMSIKDQITSPPAQSLYEARQLTSVVVSASSGGCLLLTTVIMLAFFIKNYIDSHKKELGILKALGYSNFKIARSFWVFGVSILLGTAVGFLGAFALMPKFYEVQNSGDLLPSFSPSFHPILLVCLVLLPALFFALVSIIYAMLKLRMPVLRLISDHLADTKPSRRRPAVRSHKSFIADLKSSTLRSHKGLAFFMFFGSFCFSAMAQMSFGVRDVADSMMSYLLLVVGLVLSFVTLFLAVSTIVKNSSKTTAMMKIFGYSDRSCRQAVLDRYRIMTYLGFAVGTAYQYFLMKLCFSIVFRNMDTVPEYNFDVPILFISFGIFIVAYEAFMLYGLRRIKKTPIKEVMLES